MPERSALRIIALRATVRENQPPSRVSEAAGPRVTKERADQSPSRRSAPPTKSRGATVDPERVHRSVRDVLFNSGYGLTPREAEVCASIVLGWTVRGASSRLQISMHTVATHRKRAYSKLGIGSQNELFARYFESLSSLHGSDGRDVASSGR